MKKAMMMVLAIAVAFLLAGCTVTQGISLSSDGNGECGIQLDTSDYFKSLIVDLTSFDKQVAKKGKDPDTIILDNSIGTLWSSIGNSSASSYVNFYRTPAPEKSYIGTIRFTDLDKLIADLGSKASRKDIDSLFSMTSNSITIRIGMDNYHVLSELIPFLKEENFEAYGPVYNHGYSEADYLEMMDFILGDSTSENIKNSEIDISFSVPGSIVATNGTMTSSDTVSFSIPLIKLLLLNDDIQMTVSWK